MLKKISSFDTFGQPFTLNTHKTSATYTTIVGGLITLVWISLVSLVTYSIVTSYLDTSNPVVSVNRIRLPRPQLLNLRDESSGWVFLMFDGKKFLTAEEAKRYLTFTGEVKKTTQVDGNEVYTSEKFDMKLCHQMQDEEAKKLFETSLTDIESKVDYKALFLNSMLCGDVSRGQDVIQGSKFNLPFQRSHIDIYPCSLPNPAQCASPEELSTLQIGFVQVVKVAKYKEKGEPLEQAIDPDTIFYVDITTKSQIINSYKMNYIYDDDIGIVDQRLTQKFIDADTSKTVTGSRLSQSIYCSRQQIDAGLCEYYTKIITRSSYEKMVIERRYDQFFGVISEIGGFNDLIAIVLWAVYFFYNSYCYKKMIRSEIEASLSGLQEKESRAQGGVEVENRRENSQEWDLSQKTSVEDLKHKINPLMELELLANVNAKSKIVGMAVFENFSKKEALKALLPNLILNRKINTKSKEAKKTQEILQDQNSRSQSSNPNPQQIQKKEVRRPSAYQQKIKRSKFSRSKEEAKNQQNIPNHEANKNFQRASQDNQEPQIKFNNQMDEKGLELSPNPTSQPRDQDSSSKLRDSRRRINLGLNPKMKGKNKQSIFKKAMGKYSEGKVILQTEKEKELNSQDQNKLSVKKKK